jgi:hypothetical protein
MLVKVCNGAKELWDEHLDSCTFAYNTSRQESTLYTPFEIMFGRKAVLPIDIDENGPVFQWTEVRRTPDNIWSV